MVLNMFYKRTVNLASVMNCKISNIMIVEYEKNHTEYFINFQSLFYDTLKVIDSKDFDKYFCNTIKKIDGFADVFYPKLLEKERKKFKKYLSEEEILMLEIGGF